METHIIQLYQAAILIPMKSTKRQIYLPLISMGFRSGSQGSTVSYWSQWGRAKVNARIATVDGTSMMGEQSRALYLLVPLCQTTERPITIWSTVVAVKILIFTPCRFTVVQY